MMKVVELLLDTWYSLLATLLMVITIMLFYYVFWRVLEMVKIKLMVKMEMNHSTMTVAYHNNFRIGDEGMNN